MSSGAPGSRPRCPRRTEVQLRRRSAEVQHLGAERASPTPMRGRDPPREAEAAGAAQQVATGGGGRGIAGLTGASSRRGERGRLLLLLRLQGG